MGASLNYEWRPQLCRLRSWEETPALPAWSQRWRPLPMPWAWDIFFPPHFRKTTSPVGPEDAFPVSEPPQGSCVQFDGKAAPYLCFLSKPSPPPQKPALQISIYTVTHAPGIRHCWVGPGESQGFSGTTNKFHPLSGCSHEILNLATGETREKQA